MTQEAAHPDNYGRKGDKNTKQCLESPGRTNHRLSRSSTTNLSRHVFVRDSAGNEHSHSRKLSSATKPNSCTDPHPHRPIVAKTETRASKFQLQRPPQQRSKTQRCVKDRGVVGKSHSGIGVVSVPAAPIVFLFAQNVGRPLVKRQNWPKAPPLEPPVGCDIQHRIVTLMTDAVTLESRWSANSSTQYHTTANKCCHSEDRRVHSSTTHELTLQSPQ